MGRQPCCDKVGLKRGPWTIEEDHRLINFILGNGIQCWRTVPKLAGLLRCGKSCRLRWINYLRPDLKRGTLSETEENQIIELHARLGNRTNSLRIKTNVQYSKFDTYLLNEVMAFCRWSKIASYFPGRTDNEIKNHWNTRIKKRLKLFGLDPLTHKPLEQKIKVDDNVETNREYSSSPEQYDQQTKTSDITVKQASVGTETAEENVRQIGEADTDMTTTIETTTNINGLKKYDMLYRSLEDMDLWMNDEMNPSFSPADDSVNHSLIKGESGTMQEDSLEQWVESFDSMLAWDCFEQLQEEFFQLENS